MSVEYERVFSSTRDYPTRFRDSELPEKAID
jgi:hypothetical protein